MTYADAHVTTSHTQRAPAAHLADPGGDIHLRNSKPRTRRRHTAITPGDPVRSWTPRPAARPTSTHSPCSNHHRRSRSSVPSSAAHLASGHIPRPPASIFEHFANTSSVSTPRTLPSAPDSCATPSRSHDDDIPCVGRRPNCCCYCVLRTSHQRREAGNISTFCRYQRVVAIRRRQQLQPELPTPSTYFLVPEATTGPRPTYASHLVHAAPPTSALSTADVEPTTASPRRHLTVPSFSRFQLAESTARHSAQKRSSLRTFCV